MLWVLLDPKVTVVTEVCQVFPVQWVPRDRQEPREYPEMQYWSQVQLGSKVLRDPQVYKE